MHQWGLGFSGGNVLVYSRSEGCAGSAFWPLASPLQCFEFGALGTFPGDGRMGCAIGGVSGFPGGPRHKSQVSGDR